MARFSDDETVDAAVIGTGAGGAPILMRLAEAGLSVVALEAGRGWTPDQDFATDELAQEALFWKDERLSAGDDPLPFGRNNSGIGVGGSTLHWTAYAPRPQPDDFRLKTEFGVGCDWPIGYGDLEPYYDELELFLGVSGPDPYPWGPARTRGYPLPPPPLNGGAELMARGAARLGIATSPAPNAVLSRPYAQPGVGERPACLNRGFCQAGCRNGAKASTDVTFLPRAVAAGAEVRTGAFVTGFERDREGRIAAVVFRTGEGERRQRCRQVFLCAGAVESPRLLLMAGLANGSGQVGRNFMAHTGMQVWGVFDELVKPTRGVPGGLISEDTHRPKDADFAGGYLIQSLGVMPLTYVSQLARAERLWGERLVAHMARFNHMAGINILGECLPRADNRLTLSEERDARGLPKPKIVFSADENEKRLHRHAERLLRDLWSAAGARELHRVERFAHTLGTCRMGASGDEAVVDGDCRAFEVENLVICDNSVYPSALAVNPALTQMALSLRTADRFLERR